MHHLSIYNYTHNLQFLKEALDVGVNRNRNRQEIVVNWSYTFKYIHQSCLQIIFHTNWKSHKLLQSVFVLRKFQKNAAQLYHLRDCIDSQYCKTKMDALMEKVGLFAKQKLKYDREDFLNYRTIKCSKFPILPFDQGQADYIRLKEQKISMNETWMIAIQYRKQAERAIRANEVIALAIANSRASLYGQEPQKEILIERINQFYKISQACIPDFYEAKWEEIYGKTQAYEAYLKSPNNMEIMA